jgi:hypothetical protein
MAMQISIISDPAAMERAIADLAKACEAEIAKADRPTDAFPLRAIVPLFIVDNAQLTGWKERVPPAIWQPLASLAGRCFVCPSNERELQSKHHALGHEDLTKFRQGIPILKIISAMKPEQTFNVGGRTKHVTEIKIREALAFEVFTKDIEIGELLSAKANARKTCSVVAARGSGLEYLLQHAWVDGVPRKGAAMDQTLPKNDRQRALFESLRAEGETLAVKFAPRALSPSHVETTIVQHVNGWSAVSRTPADFDEALATAALPVNILMKACAFVTELTKAKRALAKAIKKAEERAAKRARKADQLELDLAAANRQRPRWRPLDPIADPMTKRRHQYFSECTFSPFELTYVAFAADVDPNLLSTTHALATPEFTLARTLRQLYWGQKVRPEFAELSSLHELVFGQSNEHHLYPDARAFLAKLALELETRERWAAWFDNPIEPLRSSVKK